MAVLLVGLKLQRRFEILIAKGRTIWVSDDQPGPVCAATAGKALRLSIYELLR